MMGLGSLGNGGSSSNLSPLAPPFTVDRSNSKQPTSNFSDSHYTVTVPFGQSSWQYAADPSVNFTDSVPTTCDSVTTPSATIWSTSNPTAKTSAEAYSFGCDGYYAPYVSPIGSTNPSCEPSFDVFSNSGNIPSSQVDYTQSLSGLEYPVPHWDHVWSQMPDAKRDEIKGVDASFPLEKLNSAAASFGYMNCMSQGNSLESVNIAGEDSCALSGNFTDRVYPGPSSMVHMDDKPYFGQEPLYSSFNSKSACMGSILPESYQAGLSSGSSKNYLNYENPFTHDKFFHLLDSCLRDTTSTSKSSPAVVIRPAPSGSRFSSQKAGLNKTVDIFKTGASKNEKSEVKRFSLDTSLLHFGKDVKDGIVFTSPSLNKECSSNTRVSNIAEISVEERFGSQAPYNSTPPMPFTEQSSEALDLHYPNVDSPCWKGAPAFRISLCDSVEAPSPWHFKSKLEFSDFGQSNSLFPPAEHSERTSSKKLGEDILQNHNEYAGIGTTNYITEEHTTVNVNKETFEHMGPSSSSGILQFSEDLNKPIKGYYSGNDSQLESSGGKNISVDEHNFGPAEHSLKEGFMHAGLNLNDTLEDGVVALDAAENVLRSPASQEDAKQGQPYQISSPKLDVQTLANSILNLSELLKSQCLANACLLEEQDRDALKHAITNLILCTSKTIETKETIFSQHDTFEKAGESHGCNMGTGTGDPQFMEEITSDSYGLGYRLMHEDTSKNNGKKADNSSLPSPFQDDLGNTKEEEVAQAIKKALEENFLCDEDMQLQALLFKNLWLEAEAKLCSISYKTHFDRMKMEMEKHKMSPGKDVSVGATAVNKILSFKFSPDLNMISSVAPEAENDLASNITQSPTTSSKSVQVDDSIMERLNILNRREEKLSLLIMKEDKDSSVVGSDAEVSVTMRLNALKQQGNTSDMVANDTEDSVMERFSILRRRDDLKSSFMEEQKDQDVVANVTEDSVITRLDILRQRGEILNLSFVEGKHNPDMAANDTEESSVMTRFNVLKRRGNNLNSPFMEAQRDPGISADAFAGVEKLGQFKGEVSGDERPNVVIDPYFYYHNVNVIEGKVGSCGDGSGYDSMKQFLLSVADDPVVHPIRMTRPGNQQSSGLYDNSSSDWEHVAKDDFV